MPALFCEFVDMQHHTPNNWRLRYTRSIVPLVTAKASSHILFQTCSISRPLMFTPIRSHAVGLGFKTRRLMPIHCDFLSAQGAGQYSGLDVVYMQMTASCHLARLTLLRRESARLRATLLSGEYDSVSSYAFIACIASQALHQTWWDQDCAHRD